MKAIIKTIKMPFFLHLMRASRRFNHSLGTQFSAAITYFSFLSFIPLLMLGFSVGGYILASRQDILTMITDYIIHIINEPHIANMLEKIVSTAIKQRTVVGITGLFIALYSGISWIASLREAIRVQFQPNWQKAIQHRDPFYLTYLKDLGRLIFFGFALSITMGFTYFATAIQHSFAKSIAPEYASWMSLPLMVISIIISMIASYALFIWLYWVMPKEKPHKRSLLKGSLVAAISFEILKFALVIIIPKIVQSPSGAAFGSIIGLLAFFYLFSYLTLFSAAWIATDREIK